MHLNNFDFLRFCAAFMVLCSHQFALGGRPEPTLLVPFLSIGAWGVFIFFSISGYLVAQSFDLDPSPLRFATKRFLRIWPGLCVVVLLSVFVLGPAISTLPLSDYFTAAGTWAYLKTLSLFKLSVTLPGVFENNPYPRAVNGSLWTIPIEVTWYIILLALGVLCITRFRFLLLTGLLGLAAYVFVIFDVEGNLRRTIYEELGVFFCCGIVLYHFRSFWKRHPKKIALVLALLSAALFLMEKRYAAISVLLPFCILWFGTSSTKGIRNFGRYGDFSYGIYIYAFPVQQTVMLSTQNALPLWAAGGLSAIVTLAFACLSWHFIEQPALELKKHLRRPARETEPSSRQAWVTAESAPPDRPGVQPQRVIGNDADKDRHPQPVVVAESGETAGRVAGADKP